MHRDKKIPVEVYSRVVGYFRPTDQWNKGKRQEYTERREISVKTLEKSPCLCEC